MRSIGFIDFYLSEWHANNYPAWLNEVNEKNGTDFAVKYAWAEQDISPRDGVSSAQWCEKNGVELCATLEELCEKSDFLLILAPSDPENKPTVQEEVAETPTKETSCEKEDASCEEKDSDCAVALPECLKDGKIAIEDLEKLLPDCINSGEVKFSAVKMRATETVLLWRGYFCVMRWRKLAMIMNTCDLV